MASNGDYTDAIEVAQAAQNAELSRLGIQALKDALNQRPKKRTQRTRRVKGAPPTRRSTRTTKATERLVDEGIAPPAKKARKSPSPSAPVVPKSAELAAKFPAPKGRRDARSSCNGGKGRRDARSSCNGGDGRAEKAAKQKANCRVMALKGKNARGGEITALGLRRHGLQRLASGEIVEL